MRICHTKAQTRSPPIYYSGWCVFDRLVTFECIDHF
jgi:hypothetical protein